MKVTIDQIKSLRERTGISVAECKKALEEANGIEEEAIKILEKRGLDKAALKSAREAKEGIVGSYIHQNEKVASIVEVNCETDFVARTEDFKQLAHDLALHVAAYNPEYLDIESIPVKIKKEEKDLETFAKEKCLLMQPFIKDNSKTAQDVISSFIAKFGENIKVGHFYRIDVGK